MNQYLETATELAIGLVLLYILTKLLGKTQFSQLTPFDFISALILGELVGNAVYDHETKYYEIIFATLVWGLLIYGIEMATQKFKRTRKFLEGEPNIVVQKGKIKYEALKKAKLDLNQMLSLIRQQGYFSIQEVEYAILESNGNMSVMAKPEYDKPTNSDLNLPIKPSYLPYTFILDGEVVYSNLKEAGKDEHWLKSQLAQQQVRDYKEILYAEWKENQPIYMLKYEKKSS
ncbi:DUF421 domain-containing protein [Cytobacillus suaedae]|nr:DUF421 domain-containing protein [Cytobacillus suaedae]